MKRVEWNAPAFEIMDAEKRSNKKRASERRLGVVFMLIKNGTIVSSSGLLKANIAIANGKIMKIADGDLSANNGNIVIDAKGQFILPGIIDMHVHLREPGAENKEDWASASKAAAHGGVTTFFDMPNNLQPITTLERAMEKLEIARKKSLINFGVYGGIDLSNLDEVMKMRDSVVGYKWYMSETTGVRKEKNGNRKGKTKANAKEKSAVGSATLILDDDDERAFYAVAPSDRLLVVHAENEEINRASKSKVSRRNDELAHADSRPPASEVAGISRTIELARKHGNRAHITHVTTSLGTILISRAKASGLANLTADTTPSYLYFTRNSMRERKDSFLKVNPPLRVETDKEFLWKALDAGKIDAVATDHAPHLREEKSKGIWEAPSGVPLLDFFMPSLLNGVAERKMTLQSLVRSTAERPAQIFGMEGRGAIREGFAADITIVDLEAKEKVKAENLYTKCGWSPFEGMELKGKVKWTVVGGQIVYDSKHGIHDGTRGEQIVLR